VATTASGHGQGGSDASPQLAGPIFAPGLLIWLAALLFLSPVAAEAQSADLDADGGADARDACPDVPEDFEAAGERDGCPTARGRTVLRGGPRGRRRRRRLRVAGGGVDHGRPLHRRAGLRRSRRRPLRTGGRRLLPSGSGRVRRPERDSSRVDRRWRGVHGGSGRAKRLPGSLASDGVSVQLFLVEPLATVEDSRYRLGLNVEG